MTARRRMNGKKDMRLAPGKSQPRANPLGVGTNQGPGRATFVGKLLRIERKWRGQIRVAEC